MNKKNLFISIFMMVAGISCTAVSLQNGFSQISKGTFLAAIMFFGFAVMFLRNVKN